MHGDGYCNDKNNNRACFFDGGDCCGSNVNTDKCSECQCHCNASYTGLIGNGFCDEEIDTIECNYDGGDCCGLCQTIIVTLEGSALGALGVKEGVYHKSNMVEGKESWTSASTFIWYDGDWFISNLDGSEGGMYSPYDNQCPFNLPSEKWKYYDNGWKTAGANEINVHCLKGSFSKYCHLHIFQLHDTVI